MNSYLKDIAKLSPVERYAHWINERESIRISRLAGVTRQVGWTEDPILNTYRFCNVVRIDDKVSQWIYHNWYQPNNGSPTMLLNVALARFLNKIETLEHIGYQKRWNPDNITKKLRAYRDAGNVVFNGAYIVRGNSGVDKVDSVVNYYCEALKGVKIVPSYMQETWSLICKCFGFGSFMAGQVTADLRWAVAGSWTDKNTWAPMGPGSKRGMNRIHERPISTPLKQEKFLDELMVLRSDCRSLVARPLWNRMEAIDWQNCLCEFDKYSRTLLDGRRPKQIYREAL